MFTFSSVRDDYVRTISARDSILKEKMQEIGYKNFKRELRTESLSSNVNLIADTS
jgi:hypothetical protein